MLIDETAIRIGNEDSFEEGSSYGVTTLLKRHFVNGQRLRFIGKSGVPHNKKIKSPRIRKLLSQLRQLPGARLFKFEDNEKGVRKIEAGHFRDYMEAISGELNFTPKNFRTWQATVIVAKALSDMDPTESIEQRKENLKAALKIAAKALGNTPSMVAKEYVPQELQEEYIERDGFDRFFSSNGSAIDVIRGISADEKGTLRLLAHILKIKI